MPPQIPHDSLLSRARRRQRERIGHTGPPEVPLHTAMASCGLSNQGSAPARGTGNFRHSASRSASSSWDQSTMLSLLIRTIGCLPGVDQFQEVIEGDDDELAARDLDGEGHLA